MTKGGDRRGLPDTKMLIKITIRLGVRIFIATPYFPHCDQRFNVYQDQDCFFQKKLFSMVINLIKLRDMIFF